MKRDDAIAALKAQASELRKLGVVRLRLFGSTARGEAGRHSDVDIAVALDGIAGGFATFARLDLIKRRLEDALGTRVDVIPEPNISGPVKAAVERDGCRVF